MPTYRIVVDFEDPDCLNLEAKSRDVCKILKTYDHLEDAFDRDNRGEQVPALRLYVDEIELNMWHLRRYLDNLQQKRQKR